MPTNRITRYLLLAATVLYWLAGDVGAQTKSPPSQHRAGVPQQSEVETKWGLTFEQRADGFFTVGNKQTTYTLAAVDGAVQLVGQQRAGGVDIWAEKSTAFFVDDPQIKYTTAAVAANWIAENRVTTAHLEVGVTFQSPKLTKKLVFRMYPDSEVIGCDGYYRGSPQAIDGAATQLLSMKTEQRHWKYKAIEFFDRTDENNNLVREQEIIGYEIEQNLNGNLLFARDLMHDQAFVVIKEAPSSFSQIAHLGYDFSLSKFGMKTMGLGFESSDLKPAQWTKAYSVAVSACGPTALERLTTLRSYQKSLRPHRPDWDEMIMMNNWGDRNRDSRYSEAFVRKEIDACRRLGITHFQIDDGWQQGLSKNSSNSDGTKWDQWDLGDWQPNRERFPNGFQPVVDYAKKQGVTLGLWFAPSNANSFAQWERDARVIINLNRSFGIRYFKIDGIRLPNKLAEENLRKMYALILKETNHNVFFNVDATAHARGGFHFLYEYGGNIFLENRYTTFKKYYYPYQTLRNLWMLSKYTPAERFQIEFLNKWKNQQTYSANDVFSPINVPFDYAFAVTMAAQPLAWLEGTGLPDEAFEVADVIKQYSTIRSALHLGNIFPIGDEPNGRSWTGFQSITSDTSGFLILYREMNDDSEHRISTYLQPDRRYTFTKVLGSGEVQSKIGPAGQLDVSIPRPHGYLLVRYRLNQF